MVLWLRPEWGDNAEPQSHMPLTFSGSFVIPPDILHDELSLVS